MEAAQATVAQTSVWTDFPTINPKADLQPQLKALTLDLCNRVISIDDSIEILKTNSSAADKTRHAFADKYHANNKDPNVRLQRKYVIDYNQMRHTQSQNAQLSNNATTLSNKFQEYITILNEIITQKRNGLSDSSHSTTVKKENQEITAATSGVKFLEENKQNRIADTYTILRERVNEANDLDNFFPTSGTFKRMIGWGTTAKDIVDRVENESAIQMQTLVRGVVYRNLVTQRKIQGEQASRQTALITQLQTLHKQKDAERKRVEEETTKRVEKEQQAQQALKLSSIIKIQSFQRMLTHRAKYTDNPEYKLKQANKKLEQQEQDLKAGKAKAEKLKANLGKQYKRANEAENQLPNKQMSRT